MRLAIAVLCVVLLPATAWAGAACPENTIANGCWPDAIAFSANSPTGTMGASGIVPWTVGTTCQTGCYDLPAGALAARGAANTVGGCGSNVQVSDVYQILGPPGPALAFEAVLFIHADLAPYTAAGGTIESGAQSATVAATPNGEAAIPLSYAPGQSFLVRTSLNAGGFDGAYPPGQVIATGMIRFRGLPATYSVVSCQNYDVPTPARPLSWGGVKALYR